MFSTCARCSSRSRIAAASTSPPHAKTVRSEDLSRRRQLVNLAVALLAMCPVALQLDWSSAVAMGRQGDRQGDLMVMWSEMPRSPGHVFYDRLQEVLVGAGFDGFVEDTCRAFYAKTMGAPSVPPGRYFRMHMVGYFEG